MDDTLTRIWHDLVGRVTGPMSFRLVMQPTMAAIMAIRAGWQDARAGHHVYFWEIIHADPAHRRALLREGWKAIAKIFVLAIVLDVVYQYIELRWVYPFEALGVAFLLACVPYLLIRGPANLMFRRKVASR